MRGKARGRGPEPASRLSTTLCPPHYLHSLTLCLLCASLFLPYARTQSSTLHVLTSSLRVRRTRRSSAQATRSSPSRLLRSSRAAREMVTRIQMMREAHTADAACSIEYRTPCLCVVVSVLLRILLVWRERERTRFERVFVCVAESGDDAAHPER